MVQTEHTDALHYMWLSIHLTPPVCFTHNCYALFNYKTGRRSYSVHKKFEVNLWRVSLGGEP